MKSYLTLAFFALTLLTQHQVSAQTKEFPNAISAKLNFLDYGIYYDQTLHLSQGFEVMYLRNVHKYVNIGIPVKVGISKLPPAFGKNMVTYSGDILAQISNTESTRKFVPYAFAGIGAANDDLVKSYAQVPVGAGIQYKIGKYASLAAQGEFRKAFTDNRDNAQISVGFFYLLHKPDPAKLDQDRDGTPDLLDKCPTAAGPATALGCPDNDKDGVANNEDKCPDQPGPLETKGCPDADSDGTTDDMDKCPDIPGTIEGCPDTDGDGFADDKDECPTEAGRWNGCPDTDLDGIADKNDKCPTEPGNAENNGCPEKTAPKDTDGDGTTDDMDECPEQPGSVKGCPDADGDGIADKNDKCPTEKGVESEGGCPVKEASDSDKDGVVDTEDQCPFIAGTANGCPDADNDSVADKDDKCPTEPGTAENKGCPVLKDSDKDGFEDDKDQCPYQAGTANGCPDADGDGTADKDDACPNEKGTLIGCPDVDNDGIADKNDKCPNTPGVPENFGCPAVIDTDKDGVADADDKCPTEAGMLNGCPDSDKDGVADKDDACPTAAGTLNGCPDSDNDGIADKDDACPTVAGKTNTKGCPDKDNDGTADKDDQCPDKPGPYEGCPDTDNDGVADHKDKCPNQPAATADGCPAKPVAKDSDNDGIDDSIDRCPTTFGVAANNGCPEIKKETKERLAFAMSAVQFETAKASLKSQSFAVLDEIVDIMRQYPDYNLAIGGHTDNVGDDDGNLRLSTERAKTCYDYLVFRGIKTARLRYAGFGELRPLGDNNTPEGRELNRRVEFELTLD